MTTPVANLQMELVTLSHYNIGKVFLGEECAINSLAVGAPPQTRLWELIGRSRRLPMSRGRGYPRRHPLSPMQLNIDGQLVPPACNVAPWRIPTAAPNSYNK